MKLHRISATRNLLLFVFCFLAPHFISADEIVPMVPCRVVDTRNTVGYLPPGTQFDFSVRNAPSSPGPAQGGQAGCGIPYNSTAAVLNIIAVSPSNNGWANLWAFGSPIPLASVLNVTIAQTENVGTLAMLAPNGSAKDLSLRNAAFATYWVIDIVGYAVPSTATLVGQATGILFGNVLTVQVSSGLTVKAFAPDSMPSFKTSWTATLPSVVGKCVHVDGLWFNAATTLEYDTVEARGLPIAIEGYCGPGEVAAYPIPELRQRRFLTFANAPFAPGAVTAGDTFIVINGIGAFAGHDREWVTWDGAQWIFDLPREGDLGMNASDGKYYRYRSTGVTEWRALAMEASGL